MIKLTKQDGDILANKKNGKCLDVGKTSRHKWKWECSCGNVWYSSYAQIRDGSWCPNCSHKKVSIDRLREFANKRDGYLVLLECDNILSKVRWVCNKGHEWAAIPSNVIYKNQWCPTCAKNKKLNCGHWCPYCKSWNSEEICRFVIVVMAIYLKCLLILLIVVIGVHIVNIQLS
jgi:hypothetical protein